MCSLWEQILSFQKQKKLSEEEQPNSDWVPSPVSYYFPLLYNTFSYVQKVINFRVCLEIMYADSKWAKFE